MARIVLGAVGWRVHLGHEGRRRKGPSLGPVTASCHGDKLAGTSAPFFRKGAWEWKTLTAKGGRGGHWAAPASVPQNERSEGWDQVLRAADRAANSSAGPVGSAEVGDIAAERDLVVVDDRG